MDDVRVRKAFNMAIDKVGLAAFQRTVKPLTGFAPQGIFPGYPQPAATRSIRRARSGCSPRRDTATPTAISIRRSFRCRRRAHLQHHESNRQIAEFVQAQWKQNLGLTVPLKNMELKTFLDYRAKLEYKGVARAGWVGDYLDPFTFLDLFTHEPATTARDGRRPSSSPLLRTANSEQDPKRRYELLAKAEKMLLDAQPVIPLRRARPTG